MTSIRYQTPLAAACLIFLGASAALAQAPAASPSPGVSPPPAAVRSEDVTVTATRTEEQVASVPASVSVKSMKALEERGFQAGLDELRAEPGVFFRRGEGDNDDFPFVNIRGVTGNHGNDAFLGLIDGIPFVDGDEVVSMDLVPYQALDQIEIVRGPVSALYGRGGLAGAINWRTKVPSADEESLLRFGAGMDGWFDGGASVTRSASDRTRLLFDAQALRSEGWRDQNLRTQASFLAKSVTTFNPKTALTLYASYLDKESQTGSSLPTQADGRVVSGIRNGRKGYIGSGDTGDNLSLVTGTGRLDRQISNRTSFTATGHYRSFDRSNRLDFFDTFVTPADDVYGVLGFAKEAETRVFFGEFQLRHQRDHVTMLAGLNAERVNLQEVERWSGQNGFTFECGFAFYSILIDYTTGEVVNGDHPCFVRDQPRLVGDVTNSFQSGFVQTEWRAGSSLVITAGARFDRFERRADVDAGEPIVDNPEVTATESRVTPKASARFTLHGSNYFYASYGEGFSPNYGPLFTWDPSQYIRREKPTLLRNAEAGFKGMAASGKVSYGVSAYFIRQKDRVVYLSNPESFTDFTKPPNIAASGQRYETRGVEASLRLRPHERTTVNVGASLVDAEWKELRLETFGGTLDFSGNTPSGVPRTMFTASLEQRMGLVTAALNYERYADYSVTVDNKVKGGGYDLLNLALTYRPGKGRIEAVTLSATNLLDKEYDFIFGGNSSAYTRVPGVPFQARLSVRARF